MRSRFPDRSPRGNLVGIASRRRQARAAAALSGVCLAQPAGAESWEIEKAREIAESVAVSAKRADGAHLQVIGRFRNGSYTTDPIPDHRIHLALGAMLYAMADYAEEQGFDGVGWENFNADGYARGRTRERAGMNGVRLTLTVDVDVTLFKAPLGDGSLPIAAIRRLAARYAEDEVED